jgi:hypothetical protein
MCREMSEVMGPRRTGPPSWQLVYRSLNIYYNILFVVGEKWVCVILDALEN